MNTQSDIARRAYELWEQSGRPHGKHLEHWLQAESELHRVETTAQPTMTRAQPLEKKPRQRRIVA